MEERKQIGTEFSNVRDIWEKNARTRNEGEPRETVGNEFSNVSGAWEENEGKKRKDATPARGRSEGPERETLGDDYWERIAEDPASGYTDEDEEVDEDDLFSDREEGKDSEK